MESANDSCNMNADSVVRHDMETVWLAVRNSYRRLCGQGSRKKLIIRYCDLRSDLVGNICQDAQEFDSLFCDLMDSEYRQYINLHGTLVGDYDKMENLRYRGRLYRNSSRF